MTGLTGTHQLNLSHHINREVIVDLFKSFVESIPLKHKETQRWSFIENQIIDNVKHAPFNHVDYLTLFETVLDYFQEWNKFGNLESQVLIVTKDDYEKYYTVFPIIPNNSEFIIVVLPQINTMANTIVDENYWHTTVKGEPVMRIHSHHVLDAYQSATDYASLNSGTLEVVLGRVDTHQPMIAYWLSRHSNPNSKDITFRASLYKNEKETYHV